MRSWICVEQRHHRHRIGHAAIDTDSDTVPPDVRFLQYQLHEGPCLDAVRWQETVISRNLSEEARWPEWTPRAVSVLGIKAIMSLWLYPINPAGADSYGALNLYSDSIDPFGPNEYAIAQALAAQISVALAAHRDAK